MGQILTLKCTKYYFGSPRPRWGRLQCSPRTPSWKGASLLLRGWKGGKGKGGERIEEGKGRKWRGKT